MFVAKIIQSKMWKSVINPIPSQTLKLTVRKYKYRWWIDR